MNNTLKIALQFIILIISYINIAIISENIRHTTTQIDDMLRHSISLAMIVLYFTDGSGTLVKRFGQYGLHMNIVKSICTYILGLGQGID